MEVKLPVARPAGLMQARDKHAIRWRIRLEQIAGHLTHVGIDLILLFDVAPIFHAHVVLDRIHERHGIEAAVELVPQIGSGRNVFPIGHMHLETVFTLGVDGLLRREVDADDLAAKFIAAELEPIAVAATDVANGHSFFEAQLVGHVLELRAL